MTLYHNRGDTTFVGENSYYGDFFGLDDLFTENPRVVQGMIDIYEHWIADFGIDGFRIDTMKHVDDAFWQRFGPEVLQFARDHGKTEFFMFGEVFDTTKAFTSHFTTQDRMQAVLDFPFQEAARNFASRGQPASQLTSFFAGDDWYTDADSNVYELPTFLGNHDMGRIGGFVQADNPGAGDPEWVARDRLAHELMYFSRGNPVVYYGDEQGFTGGGRGDQDARQTMFASQVPDYLDDDLIGTDATHAQSNFVPSHPLYQAISRLAAVTREHPALRDGAQQGRYADSGAGVYAFSRIDRDEQREYVVALNNSEQPRTVAVPTYVAQAELPPRVRQRSRPRAHDRGPHADADRAATVHRGLRLGRADPPLARRRPAVTLNAPAPAAQSRGRMQVTANVRRLVVLRGHVLRQGRRRPVDLRRHRRQRAVPGVPRRRAVCTPARPCSTAPWCWTTAGTRRPARPAAPRCRRRWSPSRRPARAATCAASSRCAPWPTRSGPPTWSASSAASPAARGRRSASTTRRPRTRCSTTSPR